MRLSLVMFLSNKKIALLCFLSMALTAPGVVAQTSNSLDEDITITSESLQGIQTQSVEANYDYQRTPKLDLTIEPEQKPASSNDSVGGLANNQKKANTSPIYTLDKINTNQGDADPQGGTIPLANF